MLCTSTCAGSIVKLKWNRDIRYDKVGIIAIEDFLLKMPKLRHLELLGCIHSRTKREELRENSRQRNINLVLSEPDEHSTSDEEVE